jgi:epoxyqueuosine reductase QueG
MSQEQSEKKAAWVESIIKDFIENSPENTLQDRNNEKEFDTPLVGFSRGDDPLYEAYKDHVGPFYLTPQEIFELTYRTMAFGTYLATGNKIKDPGSPVAKPEELAIISWILPQTKATKADNRKEDFYPAERWARARIFGEQVNAKLRKHVVATLTAAGIQAVAPSLTPQFGMRISPKYGFASTWSERHAAYAAGLGTFALCDGMITPVGKAMRTASVVARMELPVTPRPYKHHMENCLFHSRGICKKCIKRCPAGAITEAGKDKLKCLGHLFPGTADHVKSAYDFIGYGCGLCQTGVPCESKIPTQKDVD